MTVISFSGLDLKTLISIEVSCSELRFLKFHEELSSTLQPS